MIEALLGVPAGLLRDGEGWAVETFTRFGTHNSTHVDAPWHYNSRIGGEPAETIDELPLDWFFGRGVVLDMTAKEDGETIDVRRRRGRARADRPRARASATSCWCAPAATRSRRARLHGARPGRDRRGHPLAVRARRARDGHRRLGLGRAAPPPGQEALERDEPGVFWAAHQADLPYSQIERLVNLGELPPTGFQVACFPLRIVGASAAPARVVASLAGLRAAG